MLVVVEWRQIPGFEGLYSVSANGLIRRDAPSRGFGGRAAPGRVMAQKKCANGYRTVSLYPAEGRQRQLLVHRLVMLAFVGSPPTGLLVNHKDGNKANNDLENLEYVTPSENIKHAYRTGLAAGRRGEANSMVVLNWDTARAIRHLYSDGWSVAAITRAFRTDSSRVLRIVKGELWIEEKKAS